MKEKKNISLAVIGICVLAIIVVLGFGIFGAIKYMGPKSETLRPNEDFALKESGEHRIIKGGTYVLSGETRGFINVDTKEEVQLILDNAKIVSEEAPAIVVTDAKKLTINLADGSENYLEDSDGYNTNLDPVNASRWDSVIYSRDDVVINGNGKLFIKANFLNGIVSKDNLRIEGGDISINAIKNGIHSNDQLVISAGKIVVNSKGDGIKSSNKKDPSQGSVEVSGGSIEINANQDGLSASKDIAISGGELNIKAIHEGYSEIEKLARPSVKGIKAGGNISISGGKINVLATSDGLSAKQDLAMSAGEVLAVSPRKSLDIKGSFAFTGGKLAALGRYKIPEEVQQVQTEKLHIVRQFETLENGALATLSLANQAEKQEFTTDCRANTFIYLDDVSANTKYDISITQK